MITLPRDVVSSLDLSVEAGFRLTVTAGMQKQPEGGGEVRVHQ